jgi:hypothetical protein
LNVYKGSSHYNRGQHEWDSSQRTKQGFAAKVEFCKEDGGGESEGKGEEGGEEGLVEGEK